MGLLLVDTGMPATRSDRGLHPRAPAVARPTCATSSLRTGASTTSAASRGSGADRRQGRHPPTRRPCPRGGREASEGRAFLWPCPSAVQSSARGARPLLKDGDVVRGLTSSRAGSHRREHRPVADRTAWCSPEMRYSVITTGRFARQAGSRARSVFRRWPLRSGSKGAADQAALHWPRRAGSTCRSCRPMPRRSRKLGDGETGAGTGCRWLRPRLRRSRTDATTPSP